MTFSYQRRPRDGAKPSFWTEPARMNYRCLVPALVVVEERDRRRQSAYTRLHQAGAHYVVEVMPCLDASQARSARGKRP